MSPEYAEAGQPSRLDSLPTVIASKSGIRGNGFFEIEGGDCHQNMRWNLIWNRRWSTKEVENKMAEYGQPDVNPGTVDFAWKSKKNLESSYKLRIEYLQNEAAHDNYVLNEDSKTDFWQFIRYHSGIRKGDLVLMDNGNLRAVWKNGQDSHLGLQFLGDGMVQYVIFRRRSSDRQISRVAGRDSLEGVLRQIKTFDLGERVL